MGKKSKSKKGVNTRARKRANEAATELAEDIAVQVSTKGIKSKTDADLFVLDTSGDKSALTHVPKKQRSTRIQVTWAVRPFVRSFPGCEVR